jgi:hypothetical protein
LSESPRSGPSREERLLQYVAGIVALAGVVTVAIVELVVSENNTLSPAVLALLAGPVSLVITALLLRGGNGNGGQR